VEESRLKIRAVKKNEVICACFPALPILVEGSEMHSAESVRDGEIGELFICCSTLRKDVNDTFLFAFLLWTMPFFGSLSYVKHIIQLIVMNMSYLKLL